jgi:hypothetical protein
MELFTNRIPLLIIIPPLYLFSSNSIKTFAETRLLFPLTLTCSKLMNWNLTLHQLTTNQTECLWMNYMTNNSIVHNHNKSHMSDECGNNQ